MDHKTKKQIYELKRQGLSSAEIGRQLNINDGTIRTFLNRHPLPPDTDVCKCCGTSIEQIPGRKPIIFCSNQCKTKWWNAHRHERKSCVKSRCICCGRTITAYSSANRKYCSQKCYQKSRLQIRKFAI